MNHVKVEPHCAFKFDVWSAIRSISGGRVGMVGDSGWGTYSYSYFTGDQRPSKSISPNCRSLEKSTRNQRYLTPFGLNNSTNIRCINMQLWI